MIEKTAFFYIKKDLWALVPLTVEKEKECSPRRSRVQKTRARVKQLCRVQKIVSYTTPVIDGWKTALSKKTFGLSSPFTVEGERGQPTKEQSPKKPLASERAWYSCAESKKIVSNTTPVIDCLYQDVDIYLFSDQWKKYKSLVIFEAWFPCRLSQGKTQALFVKMWHSPKIMRRYFAWRKENRSTVQYTNLCM